MNMDAIFMHAIIIRVWRVSVGLSW